MYHMHCPMIGFTKYLFLYLTNIFTVDLRDWLCNYLELSPPKPLDQLKNVTVRTFHICPGIVHEHIFSAKSCQKVPKKPKDDFPYKYSLEAIE